MVSLLLIVEQGAKWFAPSSVNPGATQRTSKVTLSPKQPTTSPGSRADPTAPHPCCEVWPALQGIRCSWEPFRSAASQALPQRVTQTLYLLTPGGFVFMEVLLRSTIRFRLHNLLGPVQNEKVGPLVKKSTISKQQQHNSGLGFFLCVW